MAKRRDQLVIAVYLRVSTSKQETKAQQVAVSKWCAQQQYPKAKIIEFVDQAVSGTTTDRPAFRRMMQAVENGTVQKIITFEVSRLSRDVVDMLVIMKTLTKHKVVVEVPGQGIQPFASALDQLNAAIKGFQGHQETENVSRRTKAGLAAARARGVRLGAPPGNKNRRGKRKVHDPEFLDRLCRLSNKLTCAEVAMELGVSAATVSRLQRLHSFGKHAGKASNRHAGA